MPPPTPFPKILSTAHFHQEAGRQPKSKTIPNGHIQFELVTSGEGAVYHNNEWIPVRAGSLLSLIPQDQTIGYSNPNNPYRCLSAYFKSPTPSKRQLPHTSLWQELDEVRQFTDEVVRLFVNESFDKQVLSNYIYSRLRHQAALSQHQNFGTQFPIEIRKALDHIDSHFHSPIHLKDLASKSGWSTAHLSEMFQKHLNESPHQTLIKRRLRAAKERLSSSNDPIKQIAIESGFSNSAAFCHRFKLSTGETPASYRKRQMHT